MIFEFLKQFSCLTPRQQEVFIFCCQKKPVIFAGSGDISFIACALRQSYKQVHSAIHAIKMLPLLAQVVHYIPKDVAAPKILSLDAIFKYRGIQDFYADTGEDCPGCLSSSEPPEPMDPEE